MLTESRFARHFTMPRGPNVLCGGSLEDVFAFGGSISTAHVADSIRDERYAIVVGM